MGDVVVLSFQLSGRELRSARPIDTQVRQILLTVSISRQDMFQRWRWMVPSHDPDSELHDFAFGSDQA